MDLEQHSRAQLLLAHRGVDVEHGSLHHVGGGALDGHVDGHALGGVAALEVARVDLGQVAAAAHQSLGVAALLGRLLGLLDPLGDALEAAEVGVDEGLGVSALHAAALGQAVGGESVDHAEVHHLGDAAHFWLHVVDADSVSARGGGGMDVLAVAEGGDQVVVLGEMGEDAEFDLRVVGGDEADVGVRGQFFPRLRDKRGANLAALLGADGDVLQVRRLGGEPAGGGDGLVVVGVHAASGGVDHVGQRLDVGAAQLGQLAPLEDAIDDRVGVDEALHLLGVGGVALRGLARFGQFELVEEHAAELLGRADVELVSGVLVNLRRDRLDFAVELLVEVFEDVGVERDAGQFHVDEDRDQRQFELAVELAQRVVLIEFGQQQVGQSEGDVGVGGGVLTCFLGGNIDH